MKKNNRYATLLFFGTCFLGNQVISQVQTTVSGNARIVTAANNNVVQSGGTYTNNASNQTDFGIFRATGSGVTFAGTNGITFKQLLIENGTSGITNESSITIYNTLKIGSGATFNSNEHVYIHPAAGSLINNGILAGTINGLLTFTTAQNGTNYAATLLTNVSGSSMVYQWQKSTNNIDWTNIDGANSATLNTTISSPGYYRCSLTTSNSSFSQATKSVQLYHVNPINTYAVTGGGSYCASGTGISVGLSNSQTGISYQLMNGASTVGSLVSGTGSALNFGAHTAGTYTVLASFDANPAITQNMSGSATVTLNSAPTLSSQTNDTTVATGSTARFYVAVLGNSLSYRWYASYDNGDNYIPLTDGTFGNLNYNGAATREFSITNADMTVNKALFRCLVTGDCPVVSNPARLLIDGAMTKLEAVNCGVTLTSMATKISAIAKSGATKYRFKVALNGTVFETAPSSLRYFYMGSVTNIKYDTKYSVSVQYQLADGNWVNYGPACTITTPRRPASPKLEDEFCDKTLATMGTKISAVGVTGATAYRFQISDGKTAYETTPSAARYFYISAVPNVKYATTYEVSVQYQYDGTWETYGEPCSLTTSPRPASPKLEDAFCDKTLTTYATKISAAGITGATAYRFKITLGETSYETTPSTSRSFYMNAMPGVKYATTYEVRVQYEYDKEWVTYGDPCNITTPVKPIAKLQAASCDVTLPTMATKINATGVVSATSYRFKVTLGDVSYTTPAKSARYFYISAVPNVKYATKYAVQTEYLYEGEWSTFGPECYITTPERPVATQLEAASCDAILPTMTTKVNAVGIVAATMYRFKITLGETSYETTPSKSRFFYMSSVPNVENGTTYSVQAQYLYDGIWSEYATACDVTTPTIEKMVIDATKEPAKQGITLALTAYPNPTKASFKLKADFDSDELVAISIYDVTGRQLETITVKPYEVETLEFGKDYINGMYQVVMTQGEISNVLKVVKE